MIIISKLPEKEKSETMPVTLDEAKVQLNIPSDDTDDDDQITNLIPVAVDQLENDLNSDVLETTNTLVAKIAGQSFVELQIQQSPFLSITKIETRKKGGAYAEIDSNNYETEKGFHYFRVEFSERIEGKEKIRLTFTTGFEQADDVPKVLKQAVLLKITDLYDNERQGYTLTTVAKNTAYESLISKHIRRYW